MQSMLDELSESSTMAFVTLLDVEGRVIGRSGSRRTGDELVGDPLVAEVLRHHNPVAGTVIFTRERLLDDGPELANQARIPILPTEAARPTAERISTDGMVTAAAVPILDKQRHMTAILYCLNRPELTGRGV